MHSSSSAAPCASGIGAPRDYGAPVMRGAQRGVVSSLVVVLVGATETFGCSSDSSGSVDRTTPSTTSGGDTTGSGPQSGQNPAGGEPVPARRPPMADWYGRSANVSFHEPNPDIRRTDAEGGEFVDDGPLAADDEPDEDTDADPTCLVARVHLRSPSSGVCGLRGVDRGVRRLRRRLRLEDDTGCDRTWLTGTPSSSRTTETSRSNSSSSRPRHESPVVRESCEHLTRHSLAEDAALYPALRRYVDGGDYLADRARRSTRTIATDRCPELRPVDHARSARRPGHAAARRASGSRRVRGVGAPSRHPCVRRRRRAAPPRPSRAGARQASADQTRHRARRPRGVADTTTTSSTWSARRSERVNGVDQRRLAWARPAARGCRRGGARASAVGQTRPHPSRPSSPPSIAWLGSSG